MKSLQPVDETAAHDTRCAREEWHYSAGGEVSFLGVSLSFLHSLESSEGFQCGLFGCSILVRVRFDCIGLQEWMDEKMVLLLISLALVVMALQCSA